MRKSWYTITLILEFRKFLAEMETTTVEKDDLRTIIQKLIEGDKNRIFIRANSDAAIVSGLIALLTRVYSGASASQVLDTEPQFITAIGLSSHLSPTRANGLHAMLKAINDAATKMLAEG